MGFFIADETLALSVSLSTRKPFRGPIGRGVLSTKYTDDETGLVMYQLRAYSPGLGRFISTFLFLIKSQILLFIDRIFIDT